MKPILRLTFFIILLLVTIYASFWLQDASAQHSTADQVLNQVYGASSTGCTQTSVTTTGHNRSGPYTAGRRYVIYGYSGTDISAGDAIRCVQGTSSVDVTSIGGSKVGKIIYANQQDIWQFKGSNLYLSCISKTATMKYDVCPMD